MLIEFSVKNFRSIKDMTTFSMVASNITELKDNVFCFEKEKINLLKSSVIYGANASGKSNLIKAVARMRKIILTSYKSKEDGINIEPFRLNSTSKNLPSLFECVFIINNDRYKYGFEVDKVKVQKEWLYSYPFKKERKLFEREGEKIILGSHFKEGQKFIGHIKKNALFLSTLSEMKIKSAEEIVDWFKEKFAIISGLEDKNYGLYTLSRLKKDSEFKDKVLNLLKIADLDINNIDINEIDISHFIEESLPRSILKKDEAQGELEELMQQIKKDEGKVIELVSIHRKYDLEMQNFIEEIFVFNNNESQGTQKLFNMSGPIIDTLETGTVLFVDELDARFHPFVTKFIVSLFHSTQNKKNAQLIFVSHDVCMIDRNILRRDQVWFTEKNREGTTDLFSLVEFEKEGKKVRKDEKISKNYLDGKYGAIPNIDLDAIVSLFN